MNLKKFKKGTIRRVRLDAEESIRDIGCVGEVLRDMD